MHPVLGLPDWSGRCRAGTAGQATARPLLAKMVCPICANPERIVLEITEISLDWSFVTQWLDSSVCDVSELQSAGLPKKSRELRIWKLDLQPLYTERRESNGVHAHAPVPHARHTEYYACMLWYQRLDFKWHNIWYTCCMGIFYSPASGMSSSANWCASRIHRTDRTAVHTEIRNQRPKLSEAKQQVDYRSNSITSILFPLQSTKSLLYIEGEVW